MVPEKTPNLKLKKPDYENGVADIRIFNENWDILDEASKKIENEMTETNDKVDNGLKTKLDKGSYGGDADDLKREIDGKEPAFSKNTGFNKNFGTTSGTVMEGDKYEVIKSIPGTTTNIKFIQDSVVKNKGDFCIDKHTGRICKCIQQTSTTTNDSNYFQDVTLDKLSDRLDNLITITTKGTQLPIISRINDLKICFIQSSTNVPTGYHEDIYHTENNYKIIPLSVTWKDNIHRNDYIAFDYEVTNSTITVAYNASTTSMSYLLVYLLVR